MFQSPLIHFPYHPINYLHTALAPLPEILQWQTIFHQRKSRHNHVWGFSWSHPHLLFQFHLPLYSSSTVEWTHKVFFNTFVHSNILFQKLYSQFLDFLNHSLSFYLYIKNRIKYSLTPPSILYFIPKVYTPFLFTTINTTCIVIIFYKYGLHLIVHPLS